MIEVTELSAFAALSPADKKQLHYTLRRKALKKEDFYFLPSRSEATYLLPLSGTFLWRKDHTNRRMPFLFPLPMGGLWHIPFQENSDIFSYIEVAQTGVLGLLNDADFRELCRHSPDLRLALISSVTLVLAQLADEFYQRASGQLNARLASLLLAQCEWHNDKPFVFHTHKYLAGLLGSNRESITVILGQFRQKGWVEIAPKRIMLQDMPALEKMAQSY